LSRQTRRHSAGKRGDCTAEQTREAILREIEVAVRASQNQTDLIDETAAALMQINRTDHRCLDILDRSGPLTAGDLASASGLTAGAITVVLDRLERSGYARRMRDTADRRRVLVELTAKARRGAQAIYGPLHDAFMAQTEDYSTEQLALILDFVRRGHELGSAQLTRIRGMSVPR
jgi:DNA-binding MarR family transcriptional regulator